MPRMRRLTDEAHAGRPSHPTAAGGGHAAHRYGELDDSAGQAHPPHGEQGEREAALDHAYCSLARSEATGNRAGQAKARGAIGWTCGLLGDHERALAYPERVLALFEELADITGQAAGCHRRGLDLVRDPGDRFHEGMIRHHLGDTHAATGTSGGRRQPSSPNSTARTPSGYAASCRRAPDT